jgi:hypothetical protein
MSHCTAGGADVHCRAVLRHRLTRLLYHAGTASLVTLSLAGLVLVTATVSHTHVSSKPSLFNQEHDLGFLATLGSVAPLAQAVGPVVPLVVVAAAYAPCAPALEAKPGRHQDSRAPPLR